MSQKTDVTNSDSFEDFSNHSSHQHSPPDWTALLILWQPSQAPFSYSVSFALCSDPESSYGL